MSVASTTDRADALALPSANTQAQGGLDHHGNCWPKIGHPEKYAGKGLIIGSFCDPYQPAEKENKRTRALLEEMQGSGCLTIVQWMISGQPLGNCLLW